MYHFKNQITNSNTAIAEKVNFFADYFEFTISELGKPGFPSLENHKSLLEKVEFQLHNYSEFSKKYINHYFSHSYLSQKDPLIDKHYPQLWNKVNVAKNNYQCLPNENNRHNLKEVIKETILQMDQTLFNNVLETIIDVFHCPYPLDKHDHVNILQYNTPILVSEFIFAGFPKKSLQTIFDKILANTVKFDNNKVSTEAPLPESLLVLKETEDQEKFFQEVSKYLENRTLAQQFKGLYFLFKYSQREKTYLFRLDNISAKKTIQFEYDDVLISNTLKKEYVKRGSTRKYYSDFFKGKETIFLQVKTSGSDNDGALEKARRKALEALDYFNSTLEKRADINHNQYIIKDKYDNYRRLNFPQSIHPLDFKKFKEDNLHDALKNSHNKLAKKLREIEKIYFSAKSSPFKELRLVNYWRYFECFFEDNNFKAQYIREIISKILSRNFLSKQALTHFNLVLSIFHAADFRNGLRQDYFGITEEEYQLLYEPTTIREINFQRLVEVINHPFVTAKIKSYISTSTENFIADIQEFYFKLLLEAYEQRNLIEHGGMFNEKAVEKVLLTIPLAASYIRNLMTRSVLTNDFTSFADILKFLSENDFDSVYKTSK